MPLVGFEPTISADERPQTYTLDRAATGIFFYNIVQCKIDYCIIKLILIMFVWKKNGSEKNIYAL